MPLLQLALSVRPCAVARHVRGTCQNVSLGHTHSLAIYSLFSRKKDGFLLWLCVIPRCALARTGGGVFGVEGRRERRKRETALLF